jgi:hypothetical protein
MNLQETIRRVLREVRVPRNERIQLYKDENIIVVVPLTHEALKKYAHKCQWCINDDRLEWEGYHRGSMIIIQRNPKKPKTGITGHLIPSEIFIMGRWDEGGYKFKDVCEILGYNFKDEVEMGDYFVTVTNDINNFATNIVYYDQENGIYDQEDNFLWNYGYEISDIPNVTPEVIKIMNEFELPDNLSESILREETKKLPIFILRRMDFNEVKNILDKEIEKQRYVLSQIRYKALMRYIDNSEFIVDHMFRETTRKVLPIDIHQTYYGELLDYLRAEYYDYVFNKMKEYQLFYLKQKYKNK